MFIKKAFYFLLLILFLNSCNTENSQQKTSQVETQLSEFSHSYNHQVENSESDSQVETSLQTTEKNQSTTQAEINPGTISENPTQEDSTTDKEAEINPGTIGENPTQEGSTTDKEAVEANNNFNPEGPIINYKNRSVGEIDLNITKEKAHQIISSQTKKYNKIKIIWDEEEKVSRIFAKKGTIVPNKDSSLKLTLNRVMDFDLDTTTNVDAFYSFLVGVYANLEEEQIDCFIEKKCFLMKISPGNTFMFVLPKINIIFQEISEKKFVLKVAIFPKDPTVYNSFIQSLETKPSNPTEENPPLKTETEEETSEISPASFLIDYNNQSVGKISFNTTREEVNELLNLQTSPQSSPNKIVHYEEGVTILWDEEDKIKFIGIINDKRNKIIFNKESTKLKELLGDEIKINDPEFMPNLLQTLYDTFEDDRLDCIKEKKCSMSADPKFNDRFSIILPNMTLWFSLPTPTNPYITLIAIQFERKF